MDPFRSGQSNTLPRNFTFHSMDISEPQTPRREIPELDLPPAPQPASYGPRRRINLYKHNEIPWILQPSSPVRDCDIPIPSIELFPEPDKKSSRWEQHTPSTPSNRLRVPSYRVAAPKTPIAQIQTMFHERPQNPWAFGQNNEIGLSIPRPLSTSSQMSDSSISSCGSLVSGPSFGGSCTSPESDFQDPFMPIPRNKYLDSPSKPSKNPFTKGSRMTLDTKIRWTLEMDNHIWSTYQRYLQDPTITPFKMVPGTVPPLGVCHRVAREAKRTWHKARKASSGPTLTPTSSRPSWPRSDSANNVSRPGWPKSESVTRKRFKELCKRKFSIAPHYQRLLQSRSPSPFLESTQTSRATSRAPVDSTPNVPFSTRDLGISLVASSVNEPLAQLVTNTAPDAETPSVSDWFTKPVNKHLQVESSNDLDTAPISNSPAAAAQAPSPIGKFEGPSQLQLTEVPPRLGSPFVYHTWGPENSRRIQRPSTPLNQCDTIHITGSRVMQNINKRRAQNQLDAELSPGGNLQRDLEHIFHKGGTGDVSQRRVRIRNRGVTLGASGTQERFNQLFSQPQQAAGLTRTPAIPQSESQPLPIPERLDNMRTDDNLAVPPTEIKRLGSPFDFSRQRIHKNNSPFRHAPSLSDPFISTTFASSRRNDSSSISETLQTFEDRRNQLNQAHNPSQGQVLSDAEKIRRQILNTPFS